VPFGPGDFIDAEIENPFQRLANGGFYHEQTFKYREFSLRQ